MEPSLPLSGVRVVETASAVAAAYAGRLLAAMGAEVVLVEPPGLCPLRREAPMLDGPSGTSALFASLAAGKRSVVLDLGTADGRAAVDRLLATADILVDDTPLTERPAQGLDRERIAARHPRLVHLSILPFGAEGPKAGWKGTEINVLHAGGEGALLPNGLSATLFPDRPPLKIAGHFAERQGGVAGALAALAALWSGEGQFVDVSVQDANVAVGAFAVQRLGDGSLEHRSTRSFRYGGVIECADGHVELLTLEERQWTGLVTLLGSPDWATDPALGDAAQRSARGAEINARIRDWARHQPVEDLVRRAQALGVPMARYAEPDQVVSGGHERARGTFAELRLPGVPPLPLQTAPFRFGPDPLPLTAPPPEPGADQALLGGDAATVARRASA
ncbi:CoA transferase [Azospirillum sp. RWY-5-1]|uniref:CoA transferase n=1 Tax=Azospirillum oleiclasticum TaxID=2735135 RepID=A0ABX2TD86_9PROT|nr:CoA transferase [Azospirillum oleiclasticum]NYZ14713.1 CoA transferase [Azospirillum oleiclasticum]NYZ22301.1 CoA transferase [Azospirillum oleiclasticum]